MKNPSQSLLFAVLLLTFVSATAMADGSPFIELRDLTQLKSSAALEGWLVEVSTRPFEEGATELHVDLFDGQRHRIEAYDIEQRGPGDLAWRGVFEDGGQAVLTLKHGLVVGVMFSPDGVYELTTSPEGQIFQKLAREAFPPCASEEEPHHAYGDPGLRRGVHKPAPSTGAKAADTYVIDVMSVYTPQAKNGAGGTAAIEATAQSAIDVSNTAFANSDTVATFNLVHVQEVDYSDSGNIVADRNWLRNNAYVNFLRDAKGADLVGMLVENGGGFCGVAYLMGNQSPASFAPNGYQVTARFCAVGNLTYPHEHGHNMGLQHDPANGAPPSQAVYPWSYGHFVNGNYRTVMSYSNQCTQGCPRVPYFSNPDIVFQGAPTGIANQRDNARTIDLVAPFTAEYRPTGGIVCDRPECID